MLTGIAPQADKNRRYTLKETAHLLGIHRNTLRRYIKEGRLDIVLAAGHTYVCGATINHFWNTTL